MSGRTGYLGALFFSASLMCAAAEPPSPGAVNPASLAMLGTAIPVSNIERSLEFYVKGLGLQATPRREMAEVIEEPLTFPGGGAYLILLARKTPGPTLAPPPESQRVILNVPDLKALAARLKDNGFSLKGAINDNPQHHVSVAHVDDPDGNHLELVQRSP